MIPPMMDPLNKKHLELLGVVTILWATTVELSSPQDPGSPGRGIFHDDFPAVILYAGQLSQLTG